MTESSDMIGTIIAVVLMRLWSMWEHRKTGRQVNDIYILMNGETQKKIQEAYEKGKRETEEKQK